jgi:hypothetical protein
MPALSVFVVDQAVTRDQAHDLPGPRPPAEVVIVSSTLHHFGPGNGPGDAIVYVPDIRTACTGYFLGHAGVAHMLLQGGPEP